MAEDADDRSLPGMPFTAEAVRSWSSGTDLFAYAHLLAFRSLHPTEGQELIQGGPAYVVTRTEHQPDGTTETHKYVVHKGTIFTPEGSGPPGDLDELTVRFASEQIQRGIDRLCEIAEGFSKLIVEDLRELIEQEDPIIENVHFTEEPEAGRKTASAGLRDLLDDPHFGLMGKYYVAFGGTVAYLTEENEFFSLPHVLEAESELDCSILLAQHRFYKQALQVLRNFLESVVLHLYFRLDPKAFQQWREGSYRVPAFRGKDGLLRSLVAGNAISQATAGTLDSLYSDLNGIVHGAERRLLHAGIFEGTRRPVVFEYKRFEEWTRYFARCVDVGIKVLWLGTWLTSASRPEGVFCRLCYGVETLAVAERLDMPGQSFLSFRCSQCETESTFAFDYAEKFGYT
jgi:hypothetical protein